MLVSSRNIAYVLLIGAAVLLGACGTAQASEDTVAIQTLILEAQGEGFEGMVAVGEVIRNRAFKGSRRVERVVMAPWQFSCWNDPSNAKFKLSQVSGQTWQTASRAWEASKSSNLTKGSRHYHTKAVNPKWSRGVRPCAVIGAHKFYNNVK